MDFVLEILVRIWGFARVLGLAFRELLISRRSRQWTPTLARVESASVKPRSDLFEAEIAYSYTSAGAYHAGFIHRACFRRRSAEQALARYPVGVNVLVLVNPERPEDSYLPSGLGWFGSLTFAAAVILFIGFVVLGATLR